MNKVAFITGVSGQDGYYGRTYKEGKKIKATDAFSIFYKILKYSKLNFFF